MAKNWKGLKIQIDADVTGVGEALKGIDSTLRKTQSNLRETNKLLKFDPKNTTLLKQQQEYLQEEISQTTNRLNALKQAFEKAEQEVKSGDLGKEEFNALQREIIKTEQKLKGFENQIKATSNASENIVEVDTLSELNLKIDKTSDKLREVDRLLKLNPENVVLISQKTEYLNKQISITNDKLKLLNDKLKQAEGTKDLGEEEFKELQREIINTEQKLNSYNSELKELKSNSKDIKIDADITGLDDALKEIDSALTKTQSNLQETNRLLKFDPTNTKLLAQQQDYLQEEISQTEDRLNTLKKAYEKAQKELSSGNLGIDKFRSLERELISTEQKLNTYNDELKELKSKSKNIPTSGFKKLSSSAKNSKIDMDRLSSAMKKVSSTAKKVGESMVKVAAKSFDIAKKAVKAYTLALTAGAVAGVKYNSTIENYKTSFQTMTGSAEKATEIVNKLKDIGAKTPFELSGLSDTTQLLMQYGFTADEAVDKMMMLGDISQGSSEKMNRIATAYGQMSSAGKVSREDINQMIEAGFNPLQEISETTGESMASLNDRVRKGIISVDEITASMVRSTSEGGKYFNSMALQSQTLSGRLSTLKDTAMSTLGDLFTPLSDNLRDKVIPSVTKSFENLQKALKQNGISGFVDTLGEEIKLGLSSIAENIKNNAVKFVSLGGSLLNDIIVGITSQIPTLIPVGFEVINTMINGLIENIPMLIQQAQGILNTLVQGIRENAPLIINGAIEILMSLCRFLLDNLPMLLQIGAELLLELSKGISENVEILIPSVITTIMLLVETVMNNAPMLIDASIELMLSLSKGLIDSIPILISKLPTIIEKLVSGIMRIAYKLIGAGVELIIQLAEGLIKAIPSLLMKVPDIIVSIVNGFKNGFGEFLNVGVEIMQNIWNGIASMGDWLWSKIKGLFGGIGDFIGGLFGGGKSRGLTRSLDTMKSTAKNVTTTFNNMKVMPTLRIAQPLNSPLELGENSLFTLLSMANRPQNIYLNNRQVARALKDLGAVFK